MSVTKRTFVVFSAVFVIIIGYFAFFGLRTTRVETIRIQVNQGVAVGASPNGVIHFLDANQLEHSKLIRPEAMFLGGRHYDNTPLIVAIRRNTWRSAILREDVQIILVFDEGQKLIRTDVFPEYTGF